MKTNNDTEIFNIPVQSTNIPRYINDYTGIKFEKFRPTTLSRNSENWDVRK